MRRPFGKRSGSDGRIFGSGRVAHWSGSNLLCWRMWRNGNKSGEDGFECRFGIATGLLVVVLQWALVCWR